MSVEFSEDQISAIQNTVATWSLGKSVRRATEELLELALALAHYERDKIELNSVLEEMADVRIALRHLEFKFGNYQKQLDAKVKKGNAITDKLEELEQAR